MEHLKRKMEKALFSSTESDRGFTIIELLIAMAVGLVLLGAMYGVFTMHSKTFGTQERIAEMQQIARAAMDMMTREIRMAGYNPAGVTFDGIPYDADKLEIYADLDGNEDTNGTNEYIKYTMDSDYPFEIRRDTGGGRQEFALNIQSFTFSYWKDENDDGVMEEVTTSANNDKIRQIRITITARTARPDPNYTDPTYGDHYRRYTLTSVITPRNLGLPKEVNTS